MAPRPAAVAAAAVAAAANPLGTGLFVLSVVASLVYGVATTVLLTAPFVGGLPDNIVAKAKEYWGLITLGYLIIQAAPSVFGGINSPFRHRWNTGSSWFPILGAAVGFALVRGRWSHWEWMIAYHAAGAAIIDLMHAHGKLHR